MERDSKKINRTRRGSALVEFALIANVLLITLYSCIEFSRLNMIRNLAQDAAYYAARDAMVPGATVAEAKAEARRILRSMGTKGAAIVINGDDTLDESSHEVAVTITIPIAKNSLLIPKITGNIEVVATATMRTERHDGRYEPDA